MSMIAEEKLAALKQRYCEPQRHYHSWAHIEALLGHYEAIKSQLHEPQAVLLALYWHDAIYDPQAPDNEDRSADLLLQECSGLIAADGLKFAAEIIRATKAHLVPEGMTLEQIADLMLLLDIDLSILAAPQAIFEQYERDIRAEYDFVPTALYRQGRCAVLSTFLERERLYHSEHFHALWDQRARRNLKHSIGQLSRTEEP